MVFSSLLFLFRFLPIILILYFIVPRKLKNTVLFLGSLIFYAWGEPIYVGIMVFSTVVDFIHGYYVNKLKEQGKINGAKWIVFSSVFINLSLLCSFKYSDFIINNFNQLFGSTIPLWNLALPIGISFYTFQTMSYTIDVYRGEAKPQKNIISFGAYVALFPQLIAGPIVRYQTIADQLTNRRENMDQFSDGSIRFMCGLGKKVLLANNIGILWDLIQKQNLSQLSLITAWLGAIAFAFQIYFDFSGYSDMAIGLGKMFGFHFLENFQYPYMSKSITEFWRRWHISLGTWFREYVYIPLGGNKKGLAIQIRNIIIVWLLTGIWHGASWNFVLWGIYFGIILMIEKTFLLKILNKIPTVFQHLYTLLLVLISWVIFAHDSVAEGLAYLKVMFGMYGASVADSQTWYLLLNYGVLFLVLLLASTNIPKRMIEKFRWDQDSIIATSIKAGYLIVLFFFSIAYLVDASYNPFLYFRF